MGLFSLKSRRLRGDVVTSVSPWYVNAKKKESFVAISSEHGNKQWAYTAARKLQAGIYSNKNSKVQEQKAQESRRAAAPGDLSRRG